MATYQDELVGRLTHTGSGHDFCNLTPISGFTRLFNAQIQMPHSGTTKWSVQLTRWSGFDSTKFRKDFQLSSFDSTSDVTHSFSTLKLLLSWLNEHQIYVTFSKEQ